jgi:hypothetical protein
MSPADILTIDGQIPKTFHILIPRWLLTLAANQFCKLRERLVAVEARTSNTTTTME